MACSCPDARQCWTALTSSIAASPDIFTHAHIALTALVTGAICLGISFWRIPGRRYAFLNVAIGLIAGLMVYLWRASANVASLNHDGIPGFSANDWLAPVLVFVALSVFADLVPPSDPRRFAQVRGAATLTAFAVNVITI